MTLLVAIWDLYYRSNVGCMDWKFEFHLLFNALKNLPGVDCKTCEQCSAAVQCSPLVYVCMPSHRKKTTAEGGERKIGAYLKGPYLTRLLFPLNNSQHRAVLENTCETQCSVVKIKKKVSTVRVYSVLFEMKRTIK